MRSRYAFVTASCAAVGSPTLVNLKLFRVGSPVVSSTLTVLLWLSFSSWSIYKLCKALVSKSLAVRVEPSA